MKLKTALVTGATGFIGSALCSYLSENGFKVRALTRQVSDVLQEKNDFEWVVGDATKPQTLFGISDGIDTVFHLAGFAHAFEEENPAFESLHQQVNHHGTVNILQASIHSGVKRFIYFSSVKACAESDHCVDETWNEKPVGAYGIAKRQAEEAVLSLCEENNIIPVILRPTLVYGAGVKGNLAAMIKSLEKGYFPAPPPIENHKSMISCQDLCRVALLAATVEKPRHPIFIVTDGVAYSTAKIVQMMRLALGKKKNSMYLPFWAWIGLGKVGDLGQRILGRRLPVNTQAIKKLFSSAAYCSQYIKNELQFEPQFTLQDVLPSMVKEKRND